MRVHPEVAKFQHSRQVRIMPPAHDALSKRVHDAVAWRAFRFYEAHGGTPGHEQDDWRQAEAEVVRPLDCGTITESGRVCLTADVSCFGPGTLEIWVEPHRVTLCGPTPAQRLERTSEAATGVGQKNWIFRTHEMMEEMDPAEVTVRFNGPVIYMYLQRADCTSEKAVLAHAG